MIRYPRASAIVRIITMHGNRLFVCDNGLALSMKCGCIVSSPTVYNLDYQLERVNWVVSLKTLEAFILLGVSAEPSLTKAASKIEQGRRTNTR